MKINILTPELLPFPVQQMKSKMLERVDSVTSGTEGTGVSGDDDAVTRLR